MFNDKADVSVIDLLRKRAEIDKVENVAIEKYLEANSVDWSKLQAVLNHVRRQTRLSLENGGQRVWGTEAIRGLLQTLQNVRPRDWVHGGWASLFSLPMADIAEMMTSYDLRDTQHETAGTQHPDQRRTVPTTLPEFLLHKRWNNGTEWGLKNMSLTPYLPRSWNLRTSGLHRLEQRGFLILRSDSTGPTSSSVYASPSVPQTLFMQYSESAYLPLIWLKRLLESHDGPPYQPAQQYLRDIQEFESIHYLLVKPTVLVTANTVRPMTSRFVRQEGWRGLQRTAPPSTRTDGPTPYALLMLTEERAGLSPQGWAVKLLTLNEANVLLEIVARHGNTVLDSHTALPRILGYKRQWADTEDILEDGDFGSDTVHGGNAASFAVYSLDTANSLFYPLKQDAPAQRPLDRSYRQALEDERSRRAQEADTQPEDSSQKRPRSTAHTAVL